jgi:sugar/nucleoside kinase (ribokinase family)
MAEAVLSAGCRGAVIKLAERGAYYAHADGRRGIVSAFRADPVVDTTGAGDSWAAGFIAGLRGDMGLVESIELANATAAMDIRHTGASAGVVNLDETLAFARSARRVD